MRRIPRAIRSQAHVDGERDLVLHQGDYFASSAFTHPPIVKSCAMKMAVIVIDPRIKGRKIKARERKILTTIYIPYRLSFSSPRNHIHTIADRNPSHQITYSLKRSSQKSFLEYSSLLNTRFSVCHVTSLTCSSSSGASDISRLGFSIEPAPGYEPPLLANDAVSCCWTPFSSFSACTSLLLHLICAPLPFSLVRNAC